MRHRKRFPLSWGKKNQSYPSNFYGLQSCSQTWNLLAAAEDFLIFPPLTYWSSLFHTLHLSLLFMSTKLCLLEEKQSQWQARYSKEHATVHRISLQEGLWRRSSTSWITTAARALWAYTHFYWSFHLLPAQPRDEAGWCFLALKLSLLVAMKEAIKSIGSIWWGWNSCLQRLLVEISSILFSSKLKNPMYHASVTLNSLLKLHLEKPELEGLWAAGLSKPGYPPSIAARAGWLKLGGKWLTFISPLPRQRFLHCLWTCNTFNNSPHTQSLFKIGHELVGGPAGRGHCI